MRLTLVLLGHTLDLSLEATAAEDAPANSLDGGSTLSTGPVGFNQPVGGVEDVPLPQRTPAWDEPEERRR